MGDLPVRPEKRVDGTMKRLVQHGVEPPEEVKGLSGHLGAMMGHGSTACRTFVLEEHDVKEWIIAGKLDRVLEGFLAGQELSSKKVKRSTSDTTYELDGGLSLRAYQLPRDELHLDTDKFILSIAVQGITSKNHDKAKRLYDDLDGIPV